MAGTNVLIGTPTAGGIVKVQYTHTIANTIRDLARNGVGVDYLTFDGPDNAVGRDYIATHMLQKGHSHLFFVDSDMWFDGALCRRMIALDRPLIGCIYAKRRLDFRVVEQNLARASHRIDDALALSLEYNVVLPEGPLRVDDGLCRVHAFGMGAVLIQRQVFETMIEKRVSALTGVTTATADRIHDFNFADGDRIRLAAIDANETVGGDQAFDFIGTAAFSAAGQIRFFTTGSETRILLNTDSDSSAEAMIRVSGVHTPVDGWFIK